MYVVTTLFYSWKVDTDAKVLLKLLHTISVSLAYSPTLSCMYTRSVLGKLRVTVRGVAMLEMYEGYVVCMNTACGLGVTTILYGGCMK